MGKGYEYVKNVNGPPSNAVCIGYQTDGGGKLWSAVAHIGGQHGNVGGKASKDTCWYSLDGAERNTRLFSWLVATDNHHIVLQKHKSGPPTDAVELPKQFNEPDTYYAILAETKHGLIPGRAKGTDCWYAYGGHEHQHPDFYWLVAK